MNSQTLACSLILWMLSQLSFAQVAAQGVSAFKQVHLNLAKETSVNSGRIYLSDIVSSCTGQVDLCREISGIEIASSPATGRSVLLTPAVVTKVLSKEWPEVDVQFDTQDACRVVGANAEIRSDDVRQKLQAWINNRVDYASGMRLTVTRVVIPFGSGVRPSQSEVDFPDLEGLPLQRSDWLARNMVGIRMTQYRFTNPKDPEDRQLAYGQAHFLLEKSMPVAAAALSAGSIVEAKDVVTQWVSVKRGALEYAESPEQIIGKRLRQLLPAGDPFSVRVLDTPNVVARNQPVTIIMRNSGVEITAKATTVDAGAKGQVVEVVNVANKKRMRAKVIDQQTVEAVAF